MPIWHRHSDPLIELSLTVSDAPVNERQWITRLDREAFGLRTVDDTGFPREKVLIERQGTKILRVLVEGVVVYDADNSTS